MALTDTAKRLLDTLDKLPETERHEVFREVLRKAALSEHESPGDDDLIANRLINRWAVSLALTDWRRAGAVRSGGLYAMRCRTRTALIGRMKVRMMGQAGSCW